MDAWWIAATVAGGWSVVSVLTGIVLGHAIAGRPLGSPVVAAEPVPAFLPDLAIAAPVDAVV